MSCEVGTQLGPYRLTAECGSGAYGRVFVAENTLTGQLVALKVISGGGRRLERELQGLIRYRSCNHPNLLTVHHIDRLDDGSIYYTMDLADNLADSPDEYLPDTLAKRLEQRGPLSAECVRKLAEELLDGLEALHRLGLVHRDVKPDNILWIGGRAVLSDIGLVTEADAVSFAGTPGFLSPELSTGKRNATSRDDFYALGKTLYCALTGEAVGSYPSFPKKLLSGSSRQLAGVIFKACGTPGFESAAVFRMALIQNFSKKLKSGRIGLFSVIIGLVALGICLWYVFRKPDTVSSQILPKSYQTAAKKEAETLSEAKNKPKVVWRSPPPEETPYAAITFDRPDNPLEVWDSSPAVRKEPSVAATIFDYPLYGPLFECSEFMLGGKYKEYQGSFLARENGVILPDIREGFPFPDLEKTGELYVQNYQGYTPAEKTELIAAYRAYCRTKEETRQPDEVLHQKYASDIAYQLILTEININISVAAMLWSKEPGWDVHAEHFCQQCKMRERLLAQFRAQKH